MRLLLHAGTHKTGTSTIQRVLDADRDDLRASGLYYPDARPAFGGTHAAHHPFAHAVARGDAQGQARAFVAAVEQDARPDETVLLSAEPVYRHVRKDVDGGWWAQHQAYLGSLGEVLDGHDVEVVLVFRRRDTFIESLYHERVSKGFGHSFDHLVSRTDRLVDYDRQVEQFRSVFPVVRTFGYERLKATGLVSSFLGSLGFELDDTELPCWDRRSTDARLSLWMAARYREDPDEELVTQRRRFAKSPVSDDLFEDFGGVTLWTDVAQRRRLLDSYGDHDPIDDDRPPAVLTPAVVARIDEAFDAYLRGKGLDATGRPMRRLG